MSIQRKTPLILAGGLELAGLGKPDFWPVAAKGIKLELNVTAEGGETQGKDSMSRRACRCLCPRAKPQEPAYVEEQPSASAGGLDPSTTTDSNPVAVDSEAASSASPKEREERGPNP